MLASIRSVTKKGRTELRPALLLKSNLESELQAQLNGARSAGAHRGVGGRNIRRGATATERANRRIIQAESILAAVWIGEVRMVENVEELGAGLQPHRFSKVEILGQREVEIPEASVLEYIAAHVSELAQRRRNHNGTAIGVAAEEIEGGCRGSSHSSVYRHRLRSARLICCVGEVWNPNSLLRFEVRGLAVEAPTYRGIGRRAYRQRANAGCVRTLVHGSPVLRTFQRDDGVDLPTFPHLSEALPSRNRISERHGQPVPDVEVAIGILGGGIVGILRQAGAVAEVPVRAHIIERMLISVACHNAKAVIVARGQRDLQSVVIGFVDVSHLKDVG